MLRSAAEHPRTPSHPAKSENNEGETTKLPNKESKKETTRRQETRHQTPQENAHRQGNIARARVLGGAGAPAIPHPTRPENLRR